MFGADIPWETGSWANLWDTMLISFNNMERPHTHHPFPVLHPNLNKRDKERGECKFFTILCFLTGYSSGHCLPGLLFSSFIDCNHKIEDEILFLSAILSPRQEQNQTDKDTEKPGYEAHWVITFWSSLPVCFEYQQRNSMVKNDSEGCLIIWIFSW